MEFTAKILYGNDVLTAEEQLKRFGTLENAIAWYKRNYTKIWSINGIATYGELLSYFDMVKAFDEAGLYR